MSVTISKLIICCKPLTPCFFKAIHFPCYDRFNSFVATNKFFPVCWTFKHIGIITKSIKKELFCTVCVFIFQRLDKLPGILKEDGYPNVQAFMAIYRETEAVVEKCNHNFAVWERQVKEKCRTPKPPERESVRNRLRQLQEQDRQQPRRKKSFALISVSCLHFGQYRG